MVIRISPGGLKGGLKLPSSKSAAHRLIMGAALCREGTTILEDVSVSEDITATLEGVRALGTAVERVGNDWHIGPIKPTVGGIIDCGASGSTLRFLMPVGGALGAEATFLGRDKLPSRPLTPYFREFPSHGLNIEGERLPIRLSGRLRGGKYRIEGNISSQFITGLLYALPLCEEDSQLEIQGHLESEPYVNMTIAALKTFGIAVYKESYGYSVPGRQRYAGAEERVLVEPDLSQGAFFLVANALGSKVSIEGLEGVLRTTRQGDGRIVEILEKMGYNYRNPHFSRALDHFEVDVSDIPDLVPVLAVLGSFGSRPSRITNASRLRLKECDRLAVMAGTINALGGHVEETSDSLTIHPKRLRGGVVDGSGDHRIVMAAAVAATAAEGPVTITGAEAVDKSYPQFFRDFNQLGGISHVITLEA